MLVIDGSEAGGQILRTSLSLSALTSKSFKIVNIRGARPNPGLQRQHLTAVHALAKICNAKVKGDELNSKELEFYPGKVKGGKFKFDIGTAGSTTLVLQTLLPCLLHEEKESVIEVIGGTDNPWAPPSYDFEHLFLDVLRKIGVDVSLDIIKHGYYPKGGGKLRLMIKSCKKLGEVNLLERGSFKYVDVHSEASEELRKAEVAERLVKGFKKNFPVDYEVREKKYYSESLSPGCFIHVHVHYEKCKFGFSVLGRRGVKAEDIGKECALGLVNIMDSEATVDRFTADQLLIYMALKGEGSFVTDKITNHIKTNTQVIEKFLDVKFEIEDKKIKVFSL